MYGKINFRGVEWRRQCFGETITRDVYRNKKTEGRCDLRRTQVRN